MLAGRSGIVGATTTDVDEVQATMEGKDVTTGAKAADTGTESGGGIGRRKFLIGGGIVAAGAVGAVLLSSIADSDSDGDSGSTVGTGGDAGAGVGSGASEVSFINWTEYIDLTEGDYVGSVDRFQDETGIAVNYSETLNDNNEFYAREMVPYLEAGNPTPWDIAAPTYWMAARLKSRDWLAPIPYNLIPNYVNLEPQYLNVTWDPGGKFNLPWQAGITGFAYNIAETGRELVSFNELFDPEFAGRIGLFTEMRDTIGLMMLGQGNDPGTANEDTINQALDQIEQATNAGQVRRFTGNDYLQDIQNGNFAACMAWSGDIAQTTNPDVRFVFPEEGAMSWFDTMIIPIGAPNGVAAAQWMNWVYDPVNAAKIAAYVQFISPVKGVREELERMGGDAAALAENTLLFPTDEEKARLHVFGDMPEELDTATTERFISIIGG